MLYIVLAPNLKAAEAIVPLDALIRRCLAVGLFLGPFGAAVGLGFALLVEALRQSFGPTQPLDPPEKE